MALEQGAHVPFACLTFPREALVGSATPKHPGAFFTPVPALI